MLGKVLYMSLFLCVTLAEWDDIEFEPTKYTVLEHGTLAITCNTTQTGDVVYWTKNETNSTFYHAGRDLLFTDILRESSGDYVCHAYNASLPGENSNVTVEVINVDVQYPMEILDCTISPNVTDENGTMTIDWNIQGNPAPDWEVINVNTGDRMFNVHHLSNDGSGTFNVACGFTGFWECTGRNELNTVNQSRGRNVTVLCAPKRDIYKTFDPKVQARTGNTASFTVHTVGSPDPEFHWSRDDGKPLHDWTQADTPISSTLNISNVTVDDFTNYTVTMNNSLGNSSTRFQLEAHGSPDRPYNLTYDGVTYNSVNLSWTSGFDMGAKQEFYIMKLYGDKYEAIEHVTGPYNNSGIGQHWTFTVTGLRSDTDTNMTVFAKNIDGFDSLNAENPVFFRTKVDPNIPQAKKHSKTGVIIGAVVGGVAFIGVIVFVVYWTKFRHKRGKYDDM